MNPNQHVVWITEAIAEDNMRPSNKQIVTRRVSQGEKLQAGLSFGKYCALNTVGTQATLWPMDS